MQQKNPKNPSYSGVLLTLILLFASTAAFLIGGCGGSGTPQSAMVATGTGRAQVMVRWPERTRLIPFASECIRVQVVSGSAVLAERLLARPVGGGQSTTLFERLPTGDARVDAFACPNADGTGVVQAQGTVPVTVVGSQTTNVSLTLGSTIDRVELTPAAPALTVGQTVTLILTARNTANEVVLITPGKITWESSSAAATVLGGVVTAVNAGNAVIKATETESGKATSITVQVTDTAPTPNPSPTAPPTSAAPIYDGFDYTPGTPVGGLNGGTGWTGAWQASGAGGQSTVVSGGLTFGKLVTSGNAFRTATLNPAGHDRSYGPLTTTPGTVRFWSMLTRPETVNGGYPGPYFGYAVGNRFFGKSSDHETLGIEQIGGGEIVSTGISPGANTTYFFVIRVTYGAASDTYDFFVNPTPGSPLPDQPNARQVLGHDAGPDNGHGFGSSVPTVFDELRIGPTWESVSPTTTM